MATHILGISALFHDAAAVLLRDGQVVAAAQEERFTRVKHDPSLPVRAGAWVLEEAGISIREVDYLVFYEKPLVKFERILATTLATFPKSWKAFPRYMNTWLGEKLWTRTRIATTFGIRPEKILFSEHHLSHAASAFLCSPYEEAAVLTVDGVGEWASTSLWRGTKAAPHLEPVAEVRFPHSLGMLYSSLTAYLGFAVNNGEYKVMGMAPYGKPRFVEEMQRLIKLDDDGFAIDLDYFTYHYHPSESFGARLIELLGPPRFPGSPFHPEAEPGDADSKVVAESQRYADMAASIQLVLEEALLHLAKQAKEKIGTDNLCMAGGVALNSVANHRLAKDGPFANLWIQPAAGDAGGALGAALWVWHMVLGKPRVEEFVRPDLGKSWDRGEVREILDDLAVDYEELPNMETAADRCAEELSNGGVVAWSEGRFEWGPRALGHRSILADPRGQDMKNTVNARIKFREAFRPFAPAVTEEASSEWFGLSPAASAPARYMLAVAPVNEAKRGAIPATTHVDGSARLQVVREADHPYYHRIIRQFGEATGTPVVLNTSFNLKGDPMVSSPVDAVATLLRCDLDSLYIEGFRVTRGS